MFVWSKLNPAWLHEFLCHYSSLLISVSGKLKGTKDYGTGSKKFNIGAIFNRSHSGFQQLNTDELEHLNSDSEDEFTVGAKTWKCVSVPDSVMASKRYMGMGTFATKCIVIFKIIKLVVDTYVFIGCDRNHEQITKYYSLNYSLIICIWKDLNSFVSIMIIAVLKWLKSWLQVFWLVS